MAQFNQLQTSASQVVNPPAGYVSFHFDDEKKLNFFDSTGPLTITASIMAESASVAETADRFTAGTKVITGSLIVNGNLQAQSFTLSSSVISSLVLTNSGSSTFGNDLADQHKFSGSFSVTGSALIKGNTIITGSTINNGNFSVVNGAISGSLISGSSATITEISASSISILTASINNLTIIGTASIKYLNVDYQSSSVIFSSGSNIFGDAQDDVQQFTGSVGISGSTFTVFTTNPSNAEFQVGGTGIQVGNTLTDSHGITGSVSVTGSNFNVTSNNIGLSNTGARIGNAITDSHGITGSVSMTGSTFSVVTTGVNPEFEVLGTGTRLGNVLTDNHRITGSVGITGSFDIIGNQVLSGSLRLHQSASVSGTNIFGTASWATNVAGAVETASFVTNLSQNVTITGSLTVITGSGVELQVTNTGVRIGNVLTDNHLITGSVSVTGSLSVFTNLTSRSEFEVASTGVRIGNHSADSHTITGSVNVSGSVTAPVVIIPTVAVEGNPNQAINNSTTTYASSTRISLTAAGMTTELNQGGFTVGSTGITPTVSGIYEIRIDCFGLDAGGNPTTLTSFIGVNNAGVSQRLIGAFAFGYVTIANSCVSSVAAGQLIDFRFGTTGGELITIQGASVFVRRIA
jgi:hypothetical protein